MALFKFQLEQFLQQQNLHIVSERSVSPTFQSAFKFVIICTLTLGILFRFSNLDLKPYWLDEAFTSFRLSGYSLTEVSQQVENRILTVQDLQKYQQPTPERTMANTIEQIATLEPQLTPLYFVILRGWVQMFGSSIATIRSLSAIFSVLAFPCLYWLCLELFGSRRIAWTTIGLFAISPIHLIYAQEARPLSIWILTTVVSCALLLQAMRNQTKTNWLLYGISLSVGFYAHLFTIFLAIGHSIFVLLYERLRWSKTVLSFLLTSIGAWISFVPWIVYGLITHREAMAGQSHAQPLKDLVKGLIRGISLIFVDFSIDETSPKLYLLMFLGVLLGVFILVGTTIFFFCRSAPRKAKLFVLPMIAVPFVFIIASDLLTGASRSTTARYFLPAYLGIQIVVASMLITRIVSVQRYQKVWIATAGFVVSVGILSSGFMAQSEFWWNKAEANTERQLAQIVNRSTKPLVLVDDFIVRFLSFSHSLAPSVQVQVLSESSSPKIPPGFSDVFVYRASERVQKELQAKYDLQPIQSPVLWKVKYRDPSK